MEEDKSQNRSQNIIYVSLWCILTLCFLRNLLEGCFYQNVNFFVGRLLPSTHPSCISIQKGKTDPLAKKTMKRGSFCYEYMQLNKITFQLITPIVILTWVVISWFQVIQNFFPYDIKYRYLPEKLTHVRINTTTAHKDLMRTFETKMCLK